MKIRTVRTILTVIAILITIHFYKTQESDYKNVLSIIATISYATYLILNEIKLNSRTSEPLYSCNFSKVILFPNSQSIYDGSVMLQQGGTSVRLPFPPAIGMSIIAEIEISSTLPNKTESEIREFHSGEVTKVTWHTSGRFFSCEVESQRMTPENDLGGVLDRHEQEGWKISQYDDVARKALKTWRARAQSSH